MGSGCDVKLLPIVNSNNKRLEDVIRTLIGVMCPALSFCFACPVNVPTLAAFTYYVICPHLQLICLNKFAIGLSASEGFPRPNDCLINLTFESTCGLCAFVLYLLACAVDISKCHFAKSGLGPLYGFKSKSLSPRSLE